MDPSQNYNFFPNYNFPIQPQNPNIQPQNPNMQAPNQNMQAQNPNTQRPEIAQNMNMMPPTFPYQYMMPPNFPMQYPHNQPYMPYGYQPNPGNNNVPSHFNYPNTEPTCEPKTPRFSSGSTDIPQFSTQISLGDVGGDTPDSFLPPTQQSARRGNYVTWTTEENKILLTGWIHYSVDSELGANQKGDTFWSKIAEYVNQNSERGISRTAKKCKSHFGDISRKISSFVGCYSTAIREQHSGWSNDDYISKGLELYHEKEGTQFHLLDEWKLVRHQPKYMTGTTESGSSGSKRKSGSEDVESAIRPEGRDATKKKSRASSSKPTSSRKAKVSIQEELSNLATYREELMASKAAEREAWMEYNRNKKLEMWMNLKNKEVRDEDDEDAYQLLRKELFRK